MLRSPNKRDFRDCLKEPKVSPGLRSPGGRSFHSRETAKQPQLSRGECRQKTTADLVDWSCNSSCWSWAETLRTAAVRLRTLDSCDSSSAQQWTADTRRMHTAWWKKVARTRLPSAGFRSWSRFLAVSLQVMRVINQTVDCHYFPPGLQLPPQPSRGLLPVSLVKQRHDGCEQFAWDC